jgi:transcriptional regulator with XRE-family HTH domain
MNNKIGNYIVSLRKEQNIKQKEFCKLIGISVNALCSIETGKAIPKFNTVNKISKYFNLSYDEFYEKAYFSKTELEKN